MTQTEEMPAIKGKYSPGKCDYTRRGLRENVAEVEWSLEGGRFSMQGGIWNTSSSRTRDYETCGQCLDTIAKYFPTDHKLAQMVAIWREWHLNDMTPGCEHQRAEKWDERPIDASKPCNAYVTLQPGECGMLEKHTGWNMLAWVPRSAHFGGLLSHPCPACGYAYGSAWLKREIPQGVIDIIKSW